MQEDIIAKVIDFLVAPHATTSVLLAEKEKVVFVFIYQFFYCYVVVISFHPGNHVLVMIFILFLVYLSSAQ